MLRTTGRLRRPERDREQTFHVGCRQPARLVSGVKEQLCGHRVSLLRGLSDGPAAGSDTDVGRDACCCCFHHCLAAVVNLTKSFEIPVNYCTG